VLSRITVPILYYMSECGKRETAPPLEEDFGSAVN
jgi:hypothetical protein